MPTTTNPLNLCSISNKLDTEGVQNSEVIINLDNAIHAINNHLFRITAALEDNDLKCIAEQVIHISRYTKPEGT